jgi:hypothetical protein
MGSERSRAGHKRGFLPFLALVAALALVTAACGDDTVGTTAAGGSSSTTGGVSTTTGGGASTTTAGASEGTVPLEGSSSCSDAAGDTDQEIYEVEGWPEAFDLTGVEVAVEAGDLVVTAHFAGDVTQDSRVNLLLGDLTGFAWDGQSIAIEWDYMSQGWAVTVDTLPFTEEVVLPGVTADAGQLQARISLDRLPKLHAPFQWFAYVGMADFCPDGNLQGTASNPVTFPG